MLPPEERAMKGNNCQRLLGLRNVAFLCGLILGVPSATPAAAVTLTYDLAGDLISVQPAAFAEPQVDAPPVSVTVDPNSPVSFSVSVSSATPVTYQWKFNGENIPGATGDTLFLPSVTLANEGSYTVVITNAQGSTTSAAGVLTIKDNPQVVVWGRNDFNQINVPTNLVHVIAISTGGLHCMVLQTDGKVVAWGNNTNGQCTVPLAAQSNVIAIAAGGSHSLALKADRTVVAWGLNASGQTNIPVGLSNVVAIAAGSDHSLALKGDGTVVAWGSNSSNQSVVPGGLANVIAIAAGWLHSLVLKHDGLVTDWGFGYAAVPGTLNSVVAIATGGTHSLALRSSGSVTAWGTSAGIQPGTNPAVAIADGLNHSMALKAAGNVITFGDNRYGQMINPPSTGDPVVAIAAMDYCSMQLLGRDTRVAQPVILCAPFPMAGYNATFHCRVAAQNSPTSYSATGLPFGVSIDTNTGLISGAPLGVGAFPITISATNASGSSQKTVTLTVLNTGNLTATQIWRTNYFGITTNTGNAADTADADLDGIINLLEFGTNLNPTTASAMPGQAVRNGANIEFTYTRSKTAMSEGVSFAVEWSDDLSAPSWSTAGVTESILSEDSAVQNVKAILSAGSGGQRFVRLRVTR